MAGNGVGNSGLLVLNSNTLFNAGTAGAVVIGVDGGFEDLVAAFAADRDIAEPTAQLLNQTALLLNARADYRGAEPLDKVALINRTSTSIEPLKITPEFTARSKFFDDELIVDGEKGPSGYTVTA